MASIKSVFSAGAGKVKEIAGLQYNNAAGGSLDVTLPISSTAGITGTSLSAGVGLIDGGSLNIGSAASAATSFAVAATSAGAGDTALASAGYVDAQIAAVASPTKVTFSGAIAFAAKDIVCLSTASGELALADASDENLSNVIGVVTAASTGAGPYTTIVQVDGEVVVEDLGTGGLSAPVGTPLFVSATAGDLSKTVTGGDWMTQVGFVSDQAADKILLQPRGFGQISA